MIAFWRGERVYVHGEIGTVAHTSGKNYVYVTLDRNPGREHMYPLAEAKRPCRQNVQWWGGEYEGSCELPSEHSGHHFDGMSCYDDDGDEVHDCTVHASRWSDHA